MTTWRAARARVSCWVSVRWVAAWWVLVLLPVYAPAQETPANGVRGPDAGSPFDYAELRRRAEALARESYQAPEDTLPAALRELSYDHYRDIRFIPEQALWRDQGLPFQMQFFHRGFLSVNRVGISLVENGVATPLAFSAERFDYGKNTFAEPLPADLGYAGFRIHYPINRPDYHDEVAVFLGDSYFRAVGAGQHYGLSVRGLAVDTGLSKPEEFPWFREFWIEKPGRDARTLRLYALLDSDSLTGAYRFEVVPGSETLIDVEAELFFRRPVERLGIAPLTSMYLHGAQSDRQFDDFRPEVHDSDGLAVARSNGEWVWRPLANAHRLRMSIYQEDSPRGFGLLQRGREFARYQDLEAEYQRRPSVWVEPMGGWGRGGVQLVEIPSDSEKYDNIVAFWVPEEKPVAGATARFAYRLYFTLERPAVPPMGKVASTWVGAGGLEDLDSSRRRFVVEFNGRELSRIASDQPPSALVTTSAGEVVNTVVQWNRYSSAWRVAFELLPGDARLAELRVLLQGDEKRSLTETWSYQWISKDTQ